MQCNNDSASEWHTQAGLAFSRETLALLCFLKMSLCVFQMLLRSSFLEVTLVEAAEPATASGDLALSHTPVISTL